MMNSSTVQNENGHCSLNNKFGITVQAILAFTAFCVLICKLFMSF